MVECSFGSFKIHTEIPLFLLFFSFLLSSSVYTNLVVYRTCYVTMGYNQSECALLGSDTKDSMTKKLEELVEPRASVIGMTKSLIESLVNGLMCLFVGPWTDMFGRKPAMVIPLLGYTLYFGILSILSSFTYMSPWFFMISSIPIYITGGFSCYMTGVLSYITDVTAEENRGLRMGLFEATLSLGILLGNVSSSYIFNAVGYVTLFGICCVGCLAGLMFTILFIPESLPAVQTHDYIKELFQVSHLKDMYGATVKKREKHGRSIIICCVASLAIYILVINGSSSVMFLYLRDKFQWSLKEFTLYSSLNNVIYFMGTLAGIYILHKLLKVTESVLVLTGWLSLVNCALLQGLATKPWHIYFSSAVHGLSGTISPMVRSLVSKTIDPEEIGKIFSVIIVCESFLGMLGQPVYTALYNFTIKTDPGIFNYVSTGMYILSCILTVIIIMLQWNNLTVQYYSQLKEVEVTSENNQNEISDHSLIINE